MSPAWPARPAPIGISLPRAPDPGVDLPPSSSRAFRPWPNSAVARYRALGRSRATRALHLDNEASVREVPWRKAPPVEAGRHVIVAASPATGAVELPGGERPLALPDLISWRTTISMPRTTSHLVIGRCVAENRAPCQRTPGADRGRPCACDRMRDVDLLHKPVKARLLRAFAAPARAMAAAAPWIVVGTRATQWHRVPMIFSQLRSAAAERRRRQQDRQQLLQSLNRGNRPRTRWR